MPTRICTQFIYNKELAMLFGVAYIRLILAALISGSFLLCIGCGTTLKRVATEQLLMSDAVDRAVSQIDFSHLRGKDVFLDTQYLKDVNPVGLVSSEYVISALRQQLTAAHCLIQDSIDTAEIVVEPRVGTLGTNGHEVVYGIPQSGAVNTAAATLANTPFASIPEISVGKNNAQTAIAKVIVYAYDRQTREPVWQSGIAKAESNSKDTWVLGAGPFQKGSIYEGTRFAGKRITPASHHKIESFAGPSKVVPLESEHIFHGRQNVSADAKRSLQPLPTASHVSEDSTEFDTQVGTAAFQEVIEE